MANQLGARPWIIDTPGPAILKKEWIKVDHFLFAGYAAEADNVVIQDANGHVVWQENGSADLRSVGTRTIGWIQGLAVPTLSSGKVYVYFE